MLAGLVLTAAATAACGASGAIPRPFPGAVAAPGSRVAKAAPGAAEAIVRTALGLQGAPYRNGGADLSGFDCSGFVQYVFAGHGLKLPRQVVDLYRVGRDVGRGAIRPGDLVFFSTVAPGASHVGVSIGGDEFIHAPSSRGVVRIERLSATYWDRRYIGARRVAE